ncbi:hypothetical protein [Pelagovum pacificum]|uniref:Uncharacterized protein n=2 Tax=Pelagovum pacificum TaxID=2588711 RepID=A0A5C5GBY5_9RHOB|nr:hypothetical protein [Pelagovum pacificum]TNY31617.1 hypothetical protein FHY64_16565 [Pelagovum pacificum]
MMDFALRPTLLGTLTDFVAGAFGSSDSAEPALVRGFNPDRETLTLTIDDAREGDEIRFRDSRRGCRIEMQGKVIAIIAGVTSSELDSNSIRFRSA